MEQKQTLFSLTIDPITKAHLQESAKWARFVAIVGMVSLLLMIAASIISAILLGQGAGGLDTGIGAEAITISFAASSIISAVVLFFPFLFILRFANRTTRALRGNNQEALNAAFQNLKIYFRYWGIVILIIVVLLIIWFVLFFASAASA